MAAGGPLLSEQAARVERDTVINIPGQRLQSEGTDRNDQAGIR